MVNKNYKSCSGITIAANTKNKIQITTVSKKSFKRHEIARERSQLYQLEIFQEAQ